MILPKNISNHPEDPEMPGLYLYKACRLCPRECGVNRFETKGFCGAGVRPEVAKVMLHTWEEPCLTGGKGAGAVFFRHCSLGCIYCQNYEISLDRGPESEASAGDGESRWAGDVERLSEIMLKLQEQGAGCIDLVTGTHYLPHIAAALGRVRGELVIPVVWNSGGYERAEALKLLDGQVDIYLPDMKYYGAENAGRFSHAADYYEHAIRAVGHMIGQTGPPRFDNKTGMLLSGTIVRHMVLPGCRRDSEELLDHLARELPDKGFLLSLLSQYTPTPGVRGDKQLSRRVTSFEYGRVLEKARQLGFEGYRQERASADECYIPQWDQRDD